MYNQGAQPGWLNSPSVPEWDFATSIRWLLQIRTRLCETLGFNSLRMTESNTDDAATETPPRPVCVRIGVVLIVASGILWFSLFVIPFLPLTLAQKTVLGVAIFAGVQVAWWGGVALAGPGVVKKLTAWYQRSKERWGDNEESGGT